jgi:hypothetical protein
VNTWPLQRCHIKYCEKVLRSESFVALPETEDVVMAIKPKKAENLGWDVDCGQVALE